MIFFFWSDSFVLFNLIWLRWLLVLCPTRLHTHASTKWIHAVCWWSWIPVFVFTYLLFYRRLKGLTFYHLVGYRVTRTHTANKNQTKSFPRKNISSPYRVQFLRRYILHALAWRTKAEASKSWIYFVWSKFYDNCARDCSFDIVYFICTL